MTKSQLEQQIIKTIKNYWRIKSSFAIYKKHLPRTILTQEINYENIPSLAFIGKINVHETIQETLNQIDNYSNDRLARDFFLAIISHIEEFFSNYLKQMGKQSDGTLGALQNRVQKICTIPTLLIEKFDEIRERRNSLIHHGGFVTNRYSETANKIFATSNGFIEDPTTITHLKIDSKMLTYTGDVLIEYSQHF